MIFSCCIAINEEIKLKKMKTKAVDTDGLPARGFAPTTYLSNTFISGSIVALVTPMQEADPHPIDFNAFKRLLDWHIESGTDAAVIAGTTGESATLSLEEHCELIKYAVDCSRGKGIKIIAGAGGNSTSEAVELTRLAKQFGVDASLQVVPYYNKPTQEGIFLHFKKIAESVDLPMIIYNVPGRTVVDASNETVIKLSEIPNIIGIKDATGDLDRGRHLISSIKKDFAVYSGDDATACELMLSGGKGNISVTANLMPVEIKKLCDMALSGNFDSARLIQKNLMPLHRALFLEANPIPCKFALASMDKIKDVLRLPLTSLSLPFRSIVTDALHHVRSVF